MERQRTSMELEIKFKSRFARVLSKVCKHTVEASLPNNELCQIYEQLEDKQKRGIWPEVSIGLDRDSTWAAKHYLNVFKRALYNEVLTDQHKDQIAEQIKKMLNEEKRHIIDVIHQQFKGTRIFPNAIESFVHQTVNKFRKQRDEGRPLTIRVQQRRYNEQKAKNLIQTLQLSTCTDELEKLLKMKTEQCEKQNNLFEVNMDVQMPNIQVIGEQQSNIPSYNNEYLPSLNAIYGGVYTLESLQQ